MILPMFVMFPIRNTMVSTPIARFLHTSRIQMAASKSNLAKLRKKTGFPFGNCKKALEANNNDLEKAEKWLEDKAKELGWSKAMKMENRNTPQGLVGIAYDDHYAAMVEINCETDFVAKNDKFQKLVDLVAKTCLHHTKAENPSPKSTSKVFLEGTEIDRLSVPGDQESIKDQVVRAVGMVGEKLVVRRAALVSVASPTLLAALIHPVVPNAASSASATLMGKYGAVLAYTASTVDNSSAHLAKQLCQHVIGMNPVKIEASPDDPPPTPVAEEKPPAQELAGGEDPQFLQKDGDDETIMMRQTFLIDPDRTVADVVAEGGVTVLDFVRFECGETVGDQEEVTTKVAQVGG